MESMSLQTTDNGECVSSPTSWSLPNSSQIPFLTPPPSPIRYALAANCMIRPVFTPPQYSQYSPQSIPNASNVHNWVPSHGPMFPPPPPSYPPPGINYKIPEKSATCLNPCIDRQIPPQEFFNSTKWPHAPPPYPVPRHPRNMINNSEWTNSSRSVNSNWDQTPLSPPTTPFECNSFMPAANNTNDCTPTHIPCFETSCYGQPPYPLSNTSGIPIQCCNEYCTSGSSSGFVTEPSFLPGHHSNGSFDATSANLPEQSMYSIPVPPHPQYYPPIPTYNKQASVQISVYDINLLLLPPPPPPPPPQLPPPSHVPFTDQNFHTVPPQFPSSIDDSSVPNDMDQQSLSQTCSLQQSQFFPQQESIFPLPCSNMNELLLSQVPSFPQNLHILHPPLRPTFTMPGMNDQPLLQVTLFNPRSNLHFPIELLSPLSVGSMDGQTPTQVTVFHPNSCIPSNVVRLNVPLPAIGRLDDQTVSQVTLFHPNSFPTPHSLEPMLDVGNINENAQVHFPLFDQHYLSPLPFQQFPLPNVNSLSVMNEQPPQETWIDPYSGLNSVPFQSHSQEQVLHILDTNSSDNHTISQEDSFDTNSSFNTPSSQQSPLEYLPPSCSTDDNVYEEIPLQGGLFDQKSAFPPTSSQLTSTVLTIKSADGRETLQITTYDLYLLLLPPPPPPPYPRPSTPTPPSSPTTEFSSEPTLLTNDISTQEDQLQSQSPSFESSSEFQMLSQPPSFKSCSEDQMPSQTPSFYSNMHTSDFSPHFTPPEQSTWPTTAMNSTAGGPFSYPPLHPNSLHLSPELTSPIQAISSMNECTPEQTLQINPNSHFMPPSPFPIPSDPVHMPPVINPNQNNPPQMPFYNTSWPHPTQPCPSPELLPVLNNPRRNAFPRLRIPNEFSPPPSLAPLLEPRLPMLVVNTPDGMTLFWKPFRLPSPGPSAIAPLVNTGTCVLSPFPMNKLCTPPRHALPRLVGNMAGGPAAPTNPGFVPKLTCFPHQAPITPARLIHLQARVPVYYSDEKNGTGDSTQNTKIILGA